MYLKRLEVQGFKSLADKIDLQFNPGISAIIGPNGSGKSNIADAVRWVLGEQSAKSLRGAKMEDVIFSGSEKRKPVGMAEVSLTLDNSTMIFPLDYSEITVTRRVYRSGESDYLINKSPCRLRDIHELFMDTGIGREGYSIIGQGRIDEILSTKSEDRRIIVEEAAGIVKYKTRKIQAVKKLNDTEQNLVRISDIINELENQVGPLEEQAEKARKYIELRDELVNLETNLLINQVEEQKGKLADINRQDEDLRKELISSETILRNLESEIEELRLELNKKDEEIESLQREIYEEGNLIERKEAEVRVNGERIAGMNRQKESLMAEISEISKREANERSKHVDDEQALAVLRDRIGKEEKKLSQIEEKLFGIEKELVDDEREIEEKKADIIDLLNEMAGIRNSITSAEVELQSLSRRKRQLEEQNTGLNNELTETKATAKDVRNKLENLDMEVSKLKEEELSLIEEKKTISEKAESISSAISSKDRNLQAKKSRLKALNELQRDYEGYHRGVKEVLLQSQKGKDCTGICGVVAEIIKVAEMFETAIEVSLGGSLQFIITETDDDARKSIEYLKKNNAGRATFLPLNSTKPGSREKNEKLIRQSKGFVGFASELISYESKYAGIIDYLLGRIAVIDNIKNAVEIARMAKYSVKLVTLEGDVINPGGAMTGGSYHKGSANLLGRVREIEDSKNEINILEKQITDLEKEMSVINEKLNRCNSRLQTVQETLQNKHMEISSSNKDLEVVTHRLTQVEYSLSVLINEMDNLTLEAQQKENFISIQKTELKKLENKDTDLRLLIEEKQKNLSGQEQEKSILYGTATEIKVIIAGLSQEEINYSQIMDRVLSAISELQSQASRKEKQIREIDEQIAELNVRISGYSDEISNLIEQKGQKDDNCNILKNDRQSLAAQILEKETGSKNLFKETNQYREKLHAFDVRRARLEFEIENAMTRFNDEFEITYEEALLGKTEIKSKKDAFTRVKFLKNAVSSLGNVNIGAIEEFDRVKERYDFLSGQYTDLEEAKSSLYQVIQEMDQIMNKRFGETFNEVNSNFGQVFSKMFGGGKAELILTDKENILESGIEIFAQPPGKKNQHLSLLSGGERALTAISLLFAILKTKPTPFCVLDEIEASLDEANVDRFAAYLREFASDTQFVVITHRKGTMEAADVLYGVTMDEASVTKLVSMKMTDPVDKVS